MARTIAAPVGRMGAINRLADTRTVQELLNQVPVAAAGPRPLLDVDGLCGPKTNGAIQTFQQRHLGPARSDGRVDPNGPTLAKLNEFDGQAPPLRALRTMSIRRVGPSGGFVDALRTAEWYYEVRDPAQPGLAAVYFFGQPGEHRTLLTPIVFDGRAQTFQTGRALFDLESPAGSYLTEYGFPGPDDAPGPDPALARSRFMLH
jgi:peptidoglycan hydrolase-like protein with peptidoglycan-binding domain